MSRHTNLSFTEVSLDYIDASLDHTISRRTWRKGEMERPIQSPLLCVFFDFPVHSPLSIKMKGPKNNILKNIIFPIYIWHHHPTPPFSFLFFWRTAHKYISVACALLEFIPSLYVDKKVCEWARSRTVLELRSIFQLGFF